MIQRIQTLYMLLAIFMVAGFSWLLPSTYSLVYMGMASGLIGLAVIAYSNRSIQIKLVYAALALKIVFIGYLIYGWLSLPGEDRWSTEKGIGVLLWVMGVAFLLLAISRIRKDEQLVKSINRIR